MNTGICPHCQKAIRPMALLRTTRRSPYRCPDCGGNSVIVPRSAILAVFAFTLAAAVPLMGIVLLGGPRIALFAAAVVAALAIPLALARLCRFAAVEP